MACLRSLLVSSAVVVSLAQHPGLRDHRAAAVDLAAGEAQGPSRSRRLQSPLTLFWVQSDLAGLSYIEFQDVDGMAGIRTNAAVKRFQGDHCLPQTGLQTPSGNNDNRVVDQATDQALRLLIIAVQQAVNERRGPGEQLAVDGLYGTLTRQAVLAQQTASQPFFKPKLPLTGAVDDDTATFLGILRTVPGCSYLNSLNNTGPEQPVPTTPTDMMPPQPGSDGINP